MSQAGEQEQRYYCKKCAVFFNSTKQRHKCGFKGVPKTDEADKS